LALSGLELGTLDAGYSGYSAKESIASTQQHAEPTGSDSVVETCRSGELCHLHDGANHTHTHTHTHSVAEAGAD